MKEQDKINQFFVQRLGDDTPGDDGWNMPSDDIFERAKVHFPKKKKKKRPFLFWFGAGLLVVGMIGFGYLNLSSGGEGIEKNEIVKDKDAIIKNNTITTINSNDKGKAPIIPFENEIKKIEKTDIVKQSIANNKSKPSSSNFRKIVEAKTSSANTDVVTQQNYFKPKTTAGAISNIQETTPKLQTSNISTQEAGISNNKNVLVHSLLPMLSNEKELVAIESDSPANTGPELKYQKPDKPFVRKFQKWEFGITHARFMIPFNSITLQSSDGKEEISFNAKNINLNIPVTRRFNKRWSITSGYSYTDFDLDLNLKEEIEFNQNATEDNIETAIDDIIRNGVVEGNIELNDQSRNVDLEFFDNIELMDGDIITLSAQIPLRLKLHQVPLLLNYSMGKKRWEWLIHAGASLEYFDVAIPFLEMNAMKENTQLTEEIDFDPIKSSKLTYGILAGGGVKYHLNEHFNIGLNTKIDVLGIPFARYEFGLFYGFTPKNKNKSMMQY